MKRQLITLASLLAVSTLASADIACPPAPEDSISMSFSSETWATTSTPRAVLVFQAAAGAGA